MTLRDKMLAVIADTNDSVAEREELVEMIAIALLTRKNLFVLGEPGQAKSYAINLFRRHITGARQFERLLSKQSDEEQLFGRVDLASLLPGSVPPTVLEQDATYQNQRFNLRVLVEGIGSMKDEPATWEKLKSGTEKLELYRAALSALHKSEPTVQTAGKIPEADIVLLDEIFKCNDGVLNSLLTALNERKYTNEGRTYPIPVISFFAASNEIPNFNDPQEKILEGTARMIFEAELVNDGQNAAISNIHRGECKIMVNTGITGPYAKYWFLVNTSRGVKPITVQKRKQGPLVRWDREDSPCVMDHNVNRYGLHYRGAAVASMPHLVIGSFPAAE